MKAVAEPGSGLRNAPFADTSVEELDPEVRDAARTVCLARARRTPAGRATTAALPDGHREGGFLTKRILLEKSLKAGFFPVSRRRPLGGIFRAARAATPTGLDLR